MLFRSFEKLLLNDTPVGSNSSTTRSMFYQRKLYEIAYDREQPLIAGSSAVDYAINFSNDDPARPAENSYTFDFRENNIFYGRMNENADEINLIENNLARLPNENETVFSLNFVADAFAELKYNIETKYLNGELKQEFYKEIKPKTAWINFLSLHHKHMEILYKKFISFLELNYKHKKLTNFEDFLHNFLYFVDVLAPSISINRSSYLLNKEVSPAVSGLIIELDKNPIGKDINKYKDFISSYEYALFRETALK